MSEEPDRPMKYLPFLTGLTVYRVFLVSACIASLLIWTVTIKILGIIFALCLPGIINELIADPQVKFRISNRIYSSLPTFPFHLERLQIVKALGLAMAN